MRGSGSNGRVEGAAGGALVLSGALLGFSSVDDGKALTCSKPVQFSFGRDAQTKVKGKNQKGQALAPRGHFGDYELSR